MSSPPPSRGRDALSEDAATALPEDSAAAPRDDTAPPVVPVIPASSLSPTERVIPTWTDPTVRRASTLIGGPLGTHASVGRARVVTPLRVALLMGIVALIVGWLAKSPCIQTGEDGQLDQGGQRPWITGCYNDIVPLYGSRGLNDPSRNPYSYAWVEGGPDGEAGRVFPRDAVHQQGDVWVVDASEVGAGSGAGAGLPAAGDQVIGPEGGSAGDGSADVGSVGVGSADEAGEGSGDDGSAADDVTEGDLAGGDLASGELAGEDGDDGEGSADTAASVAPLVVGDADLVGDEASGFERVVDGELVPVPPGSAGTIRHLEYPALTGYFMWGAAALTSQYLNFAHDTGLVPTPLDVGAYFTITAILLALLYLWAIASTARIARRRIWDVALMCLSPLLMLHAFTNWDLLAVGFTAAAMAAWARGRSHWTGALLAGLLLGLGTAAKLYPLLLLGPLLVLCLRSGKMHSFFWALGGAIAAWLAVNLPILLTYPQAWREFFALNSSRGPEWDSWYFLSTVIAPIDRWWSDLAGEATGLLNGLSLVLFAIACGAIAWLTLSAERRPRFAQLAFLVVVAFLLTNKVFSPQYSLWLLPLVVLALPRWRLVLAWQLSEVAVWFLLMLSFDTDAGKNLSIHPFAVAAVVRDVLLIVIAVRVIREILHPDRDLVRLAGDDDPSGGPLEDAPDRWTVPSLPAVSRRWRRRHEAREASTADRAAEADAAPETDAAPEADAAPEGDRALASDTPALAGRDPSGGSGH